MPRRSKGPRLWLRPEQTSEDGRLFRRASWIILNGGRHIATGCLAKEVAAAESALVGHILSKYRPNRRGELEQVSIADVLSIYLNDRGGNHPRPRQLSARLARLNEFWGSLSLADVTGDACRRYATARGNAGGARRDLEDLRTAINHHAKEGLHRGVIRVVLPPKGPHALGG